MSVEMRLANMVRGYYGRDLAQSQSTSSSNRFVDLYQGLNDADVSVRLSALNAIAARFEEGETEGWVLDAVVELGISMQGRVDEERSALLRVVGVSRDEELMEQFIALLDTPDLEPRWVAATVLGYARYAPAVPALTRALAHADSALAGTLTWALGQIGDRDAQNILLALVEQDQFARSAAIALGQCGCVEAVDAIAELLRSENSEDALAAVLGLLALTQRKNEEPRLAIALGRHRSALEACGRHPSATIASHAIECLMTMSRAPAHALVAQALSQPSHDFEPALGVPDPVSAKLN